MSVFYFNSFNQIMYRRFYKEGFAWFSFKETLMSISYCEKGEITPLNQLQNKLRVWL